LADQRLVSSRVWLNIPQPEHKKRRKNDAIAAKLRMMKNPHGRTPCLETGRETTLNADYNAKASGLSVPSCASPSLPRRVELSVGAEFAGSRLDSALAALDPRHSRARLQDWIREGRVSVDGAVVFEPRKKLWGGEVLVVVEAADSRESSETPEAIALKIVFEDDALIVLDKPPGLVVHPGNGNWNGTLLNALLFHSPPLKNLPRAGIVHRLDKDTSGLMVVAKTLLAQTDLVRQLQARTVKRLYAALARGRIEHGGTVDAPIGRHPVVRTRMAARSSGKPARTHYRVLKHFSDCTLIECSLETGRTHQIRVHMAHIGHPLVGDPVYGTSTSRVPAGPAFPRQALHAFRLGLKHPETGCAMRWTVDPPEDMRALIETLRHPTEGARARNESRDDGAGVLFARGSAYEDGKGDEGDGDAIEEAMK
jgi:23S rRNA pseudouridine1911/1915/1917 synthase